MNTNFFKLFIFLVNSMPLFATYCMEKDASHKPIPANLATTLQQRYAKSLRIDPLNINKDEIIYSISGSIGGLQENIILTKKMDLNRFYGIIFSYKLTENSDDIFIARDIRSGPLNSKLMCRYWRECNEYHIWLNQQDKNPELKEIQ